MIRLLRLPRLLTSLTLLGIAIAGGPGLAGLEAYQHAHRTGPGHGHRIHLEARGGQDHDDACGAWRGSSPVRLPALGGTTIRTTEVFVPTLRVTVRDLYLSDLVLLPPSRAPPSL
jgi:hypothetical protein